MIIGFRNNRRISNRAFLLVLLTLQALFLRGIPLSNLLNPILNIETMIVRAITEEEDKVSLRDANSKRERPVLEHDISAETLAEINVMIIDLNVMSLIRKGKKSSHSMQT